ncbi:hypothetical protein Micbo1qcDRAFT_222657 [Microdochium bolleyi]|uniref:Uncharacterized protein n=1 Tax=Microdochium bolleyi TaxID=196109 RepID=A0A136J6X1_9PEZI|nr:hypothetical protein Micbo1qcDRAFT_222657 [Microdochium bolleyi]
MTATTSFRSSLLRASCAKLGILAAPSLRRMLRTARGLSTTLVGRIASLGIIIQIDPPLFVLMILLPVLSVQICTTGQSGPVQWTRANRRWATVESQRKAQLGRELRQSFPKGSQRVQTARALAQIPMTPPKV